MSEFDIILREGQFFVDRTASTVMDLLFVGDGVTPLSGLKPVGGTFSVPPSDGQTYSMYNGQWVPNALVGDDELEPIAFTATPMVGEGGSGSGSVGEIRAFLLPEPPKGWLECDGSELLQADYPKLAKALESLDQGFVIDETAFLLPDLRDEFIRGRNPDRAVGTKQGDAIRNISGYVGATFWDNNVQSYTRGPITNTMYMWSRWVATAAGSGNGGFGHSVLDASLQVPTAEEVRPRNIAACVCIKY